MTCLIFGTCCVCAQTEVKVWTQTLGESDYDYGYAMATDPAKNVIVTGRTHSSLAGALSGTYDMFVAQYDASGNRQWMAQRGTSAQESGEGVVTDSAGNVYVTGYTGGDLDGNTSAGGWDIFLMKFDAAGNWKWTVQDGTFAGTAGAGTVSGSVSPAAQSMDLRVALRPAIEAPPDIVVRLTGPWQKPRQSPELAGFLRWLAEKPANVAKP